MTVAAAKALTPVDPATLEPVGTVEVTPPEAIPRSSPRRGSCSGGGRSRATTSAGRCSSALPTSCSTRPTSSPRRSRAETGKPVLEAYTAELFLALEQLRWTAANAERVIGGERVRFTQPYLRHKRGRLLYEPYGAVAVIAPWNFPFGIPFTQTIAAVAAGNAVIVKPSELAPLSGAWVERAFEAAGAPPGLVRVAQGDGSTGEELVRARGIAKVFFTGSTARWAQGCARGGRAPVPRVARAGRQGRDARLRGRGSRPRRRGRALGLLLELRPDLRQRRADLRRARPYQPFVEELGRRAARLRIGPGSDFRTELGPLISEQQRAKVERLVTEAVDGERARRPEAAVPTSASRAGSTSRPC